MTIRIVSWNINGIRSNIVCNGSLNKKIKKVETLEPVCNLNILISKYSPDIICFQETRCNDIVGEIFQINDYPHKFWNFSKGDGARGGCRYSGTSIWSKNKPINHIECEFMEEEGRFIMLEYNDFYLINVYVPNSGSNIEYRKHVWDKKIYELLDSYHKTSKKPIIYTGDLNIVSDIIDIWNPGTLYNATMPGCLYFERENFKSLMNIGYIDVYRELNPTGEKYTWWNMRTKAREVNRGWRIDYFLIHDKYKHLLRKCDILCDIYGSDHCPILLDFDGQNDNEHDKHSKNDSKNWDDIIPPIPEIPINSLPPYNMIFNSFSHFEAKDTKIVIIGQDPYHRVGQATGLSFSVPVDLKVPPSLKNIIKELNSDLSLNLPLDNGDLTSWVKQGVLLLNCALTVPIGKPGEHLKLWEPITNTIIKNLSDNYNDIIFILWGNFAISKKAYINHNCPILEGGHPSPLNRHLKENFFGKKFFSNANKILLEKGKTQINWII